MKRVIRTLFIAGTVFATFAGCGDDTTKALTTAAGVGGGALLGNHLAGKKDKTLGMLVGGAAGGGLGYLLGSSISGGGEKK